MVNDTTGNKSKNTRGFNRSKTRNNSSSNNNDIPITNNGFKGLGLSDPVYRGIVKMGYKNPTPVQRKSIPILLTGCDSVVMARTGSGKTMAFCIPLVEKLLQIQQQQNVTSASTSLTSAAAPPLLPNGNNVRAIILSPTRELSQQTLKVLIKLLNGGINDTKNNNNENSNTDDHSIVTTMTNKKIRCVGIHGAESMEKQFHLLSNNPDVIVATPGRLGHHLNEINDFNLNNCQICILDEADRLLEMGFAIQLKQIVKTIPESCQKILLSATMPRSLLEFTKGIPGSGMNGFTTDPVMIRLDQDASVSAELRIIFLSCRSIEKDAALLTIMDQIKQDKECHITNKKSNKDKKLLQQKQQQQPSTTNSDPYESASSSTRTGLTLIFAATRHHVEYIAALLSASGYGDEVTMIYGTLDQDARKQNLYQFKSNKKSILVVTDVAARGIDVPLIDHVIHYHFPSSSKLFIHRSGRAARAGRIGFCWSLIDPEEMPYMVDLHTFLGHTPTTMKRTTTSTSASTKISKSSGNDDANTDAIDPVPVVNDELEEETTYTLDEMTPDMVHFGSIPEMLLSNEIENVQRVLNSELCSSKESEMIRSLSKVCANAMKQYRKTRSEASRAGVRKAKAILEGTRIETGQRIDHDGSIPSHPLLRNVEIQWYQNLHTKQQQLQEQQQKQLQHKVGTGTLEQNQSSVNSNTLFTNTITNVTESIDNMKKREEFLRAMSNFRPKETIFEAFATGKNTSKDSNVASQIDKGRTSNISNKKKNLLGSQTSAVALAAMKDMRRQMRIARDKGSTLLVAGTTSALTVNGELPLDTNNENDINDNVEDDNSYSDVMDSDDIIHDTSEVTNNQNKTLHALSSSKETVSATDAKRKLSKAERKRLKTSTDTTNDVLPNAPTNNSTSELKSKKLMRGTDFRDTTFFIENDLSSNTAEAQRSRQIELSMLPSSSNTMKGTFSRALRMEEAMLDIVGDENDELVKRQRMMRWDKSKRKYVQTTVGSELSGDSKSKKLKLESGQVIKSDKLKLGELYEKWQKKTNRSIGRTGIFDDAPDDTIPYSKKSKKSQGDNNNKGGSGRDTDKPIIKSSAQIKKDRAAKKDSTLKNMKKEDRRRVLGIRKKNQSTSNSIDKSKMSKAAIKSSNLGSNRNSSSAGKKYGSNTSSGKPRVTKRGR